MSKTSPLVVGTVVSVRRYPVKSMQGEDLNAAWLTLRGLLGDRALALVDAADGKIVSAKNPRKWPAMFDFHSEFLQPPQRGEPLPPVRITLPDGSRLTSDQPDIDEALSRTLARRVRLASSASDQQILEEYWPDIEGLSQRDTVTEEGIPAGTFFDGAPVHLLTTATLERLRECYPPGRFEARRFRPNIVVQGAGGSAEFLEDSWLERTVSIGDEAQLRIWRRCPRCVMTTLPQADLPADPGVLRTAVRQNEGYVGVYATVLREGLIRRGDLVRLEA